MAAAGALSGLFGGITGANRQKKAIEDQRAAALGRLADSEREARNSFERARYEAARNAGRADQALDRQATQLETAFNSFTGDYNYGQEAQSLQNQITQMNAGGSFGGAYSDMGYGGVRSGSSNYQALAQQEDLYEQQFSLALEGQRRDSENQLRNAFTSFDNSLYQISEGRGEAEYLRDSFQMGGSQYGAFQDQMTTMQNERDRITRSADTALDNAALGPMDYITAILGGGTGGFQTGVNIGSAADDFLTPAPKAKIPNKNGGIKIYPKMGG
jgi:type II secretory pathway pseudopilin PulG